MLCTKSIAVPLPHEGVRIYNSCIYFQIVFTSLNLLNLCSVLAAQLAEGVAGSSVCYEGLCAMLEDLQEQAMPSILLREDQRLFLLLIMCFPCLMKTSLYCSC